MKKLVKMSLVAAVTLTGLTSNLSANTLAEVANNFDVFGYAQVRYDDSDVNGAKYTHKEVLGASGKLTDDISYMFAGANLEVDDTSGSAPYSGVLMVYNYFTYTGIQNTSISAGKVGVDTPLTVVYDPATATSEANGLTLTSKLANINFTASYFANTNFDYGDTVGIFPGTAITGGESYIQAGLNTKIGEVSLDGLYATMEDKYKTYTLGASAGIDAGSVKITPSVRYTASDIDGVNVDHELWKAGVKVQAGIVGAEVAYGQTGDGGWVTFDTDASANLKGWKVGLLGNDDSKLIKAGLNVDVVPKLNLSLTYADMERKTTDVNEIYATATYKITKGLTAYVRMAQVDDDLNTDKETVGRANILWLF
ncbi:hypothetical protein KO488_14720 [Poseidonibacter lekithochrous]|uniref:hypothetical protein n=1 Tax=Poseidonibacter TaxID=2321187 RepID=UPI001C08F764|nr:MULTISPECIES: hypothetical protein [Poseidonibacter]MBU3016008.1 hypothetical protein [Poseidonibacter lekithochrous]MDO6829307.1 hypothetical protein [Poseidonibacter sp. 1_MG-2023]